MKQADLKVIGFFAGIAAFAVLVYAGWDAGERREFKAYARCPEGYEIFQSTTFGYSLCLPGSWAGRYATENRDHTIFFIHAGEPPEVLFGITAVPEAFWDEYTELRGGQTEIGRDDGRVFVLSAPDPKDAAGKSEEYRRFAADIPAIGRSLGFSPYKSLDRTIEDYLESSVALRGNGGKPFAAYEILGRDEKEGGKFAYYLWMHTQEFIERDGSLRRGTAMSVPIVVYAAPQFAGYAVTGHEGPRSGNLFYEDLHRLFPERVTQSEWFAPDLAYHNEHVLVLTQIARSRARAHFQIPLDRRFGFLRGIAGREGKTFMKVDEAAWLTGPEAAEAYRLAGQCGSLTEQCEPPNGFFILNPTREESMYEIGADADITLATLSMQETGIVRPDKISYADFAERLVAEKDYYDSIPFRLEIEGGRLVALTEQYIP